jgi:hypothetical protein
MPTLLFAFSCPNPNNLIPSDATIPRVHWVLRESSFFECYCSEASRQQQRI